MKTRSTPTIWIDWGGGERDQREEQHAEQRSDRPRGLGKLRLEGTRRNKGAGDEEERGERHDAEEGESRGSISRRFTASTLPKRSVVAAVAVNGGERQEEKAEAQ